MRRLLILAIGLVLGAILGYVAYGEVGHRDATVEAVFSPGADTELIALIRHANRSIDVEMFEFSNVELQDELIDADRRGVRVRVILESRLDGNQNVKAAERLRRGGVEVRWASLKFKNTHSKSAVFDDDVVWVGSPNWSYNGMQRNRESAIVVKESSVAGEFEGIFENDWLIAAAS